MADIYILGIHDGHNCGASLSCNGVVLASVSEERLTRKKNEVGYPRLSIEDVLKIGGVDASQLTEVAYASNFMHEEKYLTDISSWYLVGLKDQRREKEKPKDYQKIIFEQRRTERIEQVVDHIGVSPEQVTFVEHHHAHLTAAYYTAPNRRDGKPVLGLTCDGAGDGLCATVSVCNGHEIERIASTDRHASLGKIYSRITVLLGMKAWEHEFKVMGMAPYAESKRVEMIMPIFRDLLKFSDDGLSFEQGGELSTNFCYEYFRDNLERIRFDTVCGAVQKFTEEMLLDWVKAAVAKTGIRDIVAGGGVFMNVKANMYLSQLPEVDSMYVMPSGGDESLSIGACLDRYYKISNDPNIGQSIFENLYLGGDFTKADEEKALEEFRGDGGYEIHETESVDEMTAEKLANSEIVARARGRMEWGARSLGNRSILVRADDMRAVETLNSAIKMRDFWMPFAPSIPEQNAAQYYEDPKKVEPEFMTFSMPGNQKAKDELIAGMQPRDHTMRVQLVKEKANPNYHKMLGAFEEKSGLGGCVNTSFNLHGEPVVYTPSDSLRVLKLSGLKNLALNHFFVTKKDS